MRTWLAVVVLLLLPGPVFAQGHPCDQPLPGGTTIAAALPHRLVFCQVSSDQIEALIVLLDGMPIDLVPVNARSQPSATGLVLYETTPILNVARGNHALTAAAYNRNALTGQLQVGAASAPFLFAAVDDTPVPVAPSIRGVVR